MKILSIKYFKNKNNLGKILLPNDWLNDLLGKNVW